MDDLFAGRGISSTHAATPMPKRTASPRRRSTPWRQVPVRERHRKFDQKLGPSQRRARFHWGTRERLDRALPGLLEAVQEEDLVIFTADHGNDLTTPSTDHSRERVIGPGVRAEG